MFKGEFRESEVHERGMQSLNKGSELEGKVASLKLYKGIFQGAVALCCHSDHVLKLSIVCMRSLFTLLFYFRKACVIYYQETIIFFKSATQYLSLEHFLTFLDEDGPAKACSVL